MNWITDIAAKIKPKLDNLFKKKSIVPDNLWTNCASCSTVIYREDIEKNLYCCTSCQEPQQILPRQRFEILFDEGKFEEIPTPQLSSDPLKWNDITPYKDKVKSARKKFNQRHAALVATGSIKGIKTIVYCMNQKFLGGSVGIEEGEAFVFACKYAAEHKIPFIAFPQTGGQKMQHSAYALMQMPKSIIGLQMLEEKGIPAIIMATSPVAGGVTASWFYGPSVFVFAESELTKIMFAGPNVIKRTIGEDLPEGFQTAGYLLEKGFVDRIIHRKNHREELHNLLSILLNLKIEKAENTLDASDQNTISSQQTLSA
jgi:acetyl-CoA carboxylase carboxyl transferase subunit beta